MQDEVNTKVIALVIKGGRISAEAVSYTHLTLPTN